MSLDEYLAVVRARWRTVVLITLAVLAATAAYTFTATPSYQASTKVFFSVSVSDTPAARSRGFAYQQTQVRFYAQLAVAPIVLNPVISQLHLHTTPEALANTLISRAPLNTPIVQILATNSSRAQAITIANAVAGQLATAVHSLAPVVAHHAVAVTATNVDPATASARPVTPRTTLNLVLALMLGFALGVVAAIARDARLSRAAAKRSAHAFAGATVIGTLPMQGTIGGIDDPAHDPAWADRLRRIQMALLPPRRARAFKTVTFTSGSGSRASCQLATRLAIAEASASHRVLLIDADVAEPLVATALGLAPATGLLDVVAHTSTLDDAVQPWGDSGLQVLTTARGASPTSAQLRSVFADAAAHYDLVIVSAPPFAQSAGVQVANLTDRTVVVVEEADTKGRLAGALETLRAVRVQLLGLVVNA